MFSLFLMSISGCAASLADLKVVSTLVTIWLTLNGLDRLFSKTNSFLLSQILLIVVATYSSCCISNLDIMFFHMDNRSSSSISIFGQGYWLCQRTWITNSTSFKQMGHKGLSTHFRIKRFCLVARRLLPALHMNVFTFSSTCSFYKNFRIFIVLCVLDGSPFCWFYFSLSMWYALRTK